MGGDILASKKLTSSGQIKNHKDEELGRTRVKSVYVVSDAGGSIILRDGNGNGKTVLNLDVPEGGTHVRLSGCGLLFRERVYATLSGVDSLVIFYG